MNLTLLVLAAGLGSRYGGLKQIDPVGPNGETIIDYSVYEAMRAGFNKLVFVIRHDIETDFRAAIGQKFERRLAVEYAYQELSMLPSPFKPPAGRTRPWGTGHAILVAENVVHEPFIAINADDFYGPTSFKLLSDYLQTTAGSSETPNPKPQTRNPKPQTRNSEPQTPNSKPETLYAMVGFRLRKTLSEFGSVSRGVCRVDEQNFLQHIVELTRIEKAGRQARYTDETGATQALSGDEIVSMNMWGFTPAIFAQLREQFIAFLQARGHEAKSEFFIPTVVSSLIAQGQARVKVLSSQDSWFGITYQADKPYVVESMQKLIAQGVYPERLWP